MNRYDLEKHNNEVHVQKKCETCQQSMEIQYFSAHDCPKKPLVCDYCQASFPADQFKTHNFECGNRTDQCPRCREYIKKRVYNEHCMKNTCKPYTEPKARLYEEIQYEKARASKPQVEKPEISEARYPKAEEVKRPVPPARVPNKEYQPGHSEVKVENPKSNLKPAEDKNKRGSYNNAMRKTQTGKSGKSGKTGQKPIPDIQEYPDISRTKAQRVAKGNQPANQKSSPAPQRNQISPTIPSRVPRANEYQDFQDYQDYQNYNENFEDEIPYEFLDDRLPQVSKNTNFKKIPDVYAQPLPANPLPSGNLNEIDDEIFQQVLAESTKDSLGLSEEERLMNEVLYKSLKEK